MVWWMDNLLASVQKELTTPSTDANRATMKYKMLGEIARENMYLHIVATMKECLDMPNS